MVDAIDYEVFKLAKEHADDLKSMYGTRDTKNEKYKRMYLADWTGKPEGEGMQYTISTRPRDTVNGEVRILSTMGPKFNVPGDRGARVESAEIIEASCNNWWEQSARISRVNPLKDLALSAFLYGEMHMAITSTAEMLEMVKQIQTQKSADGGKASKAEVARVERLSLLAPYLYTVWNPNAGYAEKDPIGLTAYLRRVKVRVSEIKNRFGNEGAIYSATKKLTDEVELSLFWDNTYHVVWVENTPLITKEHELPGIPVVVSIAEGSDLFDKIEDKIQAPLYGYEKSGMWENENLQQTVLFTRIRELGMTPIVMHKQVVGGGDLVIDISKSPARIELTPGEEMQFLTTKGIIDDSFPVAAQTIEEVSNRSTVQPQLFGQPMSGNRTSWEVNTTISAAKLPLMGVKEQLGLIISSAMEYSMMWAKMGGQKIGDLSPKDIPDNLQIETIIDMQLPQDKLQMATLAGMIVEKELASTEWAQKEILGIGQSVQMAEDIAAEQMYKAMVQAELQKIMLNAQMQAQQMMAQAQAQQQPQGQPGQEQIPPDALQQMMQNGGSAPMAGQVSGQEFNPAMGGLPPAMAGQIPTSTQPGMEGLP